MDSTLLVRIHTISVMLFLLTYVIKTILLFSNKSALEKYSSITKVPEMILSLAFFVTGIWLFVIIGGIKTMQIIKLVFVLVSIPLAVVGFKKQKKGVALLALVLIVGAYGLAEMSKSKPYIPAGGSVTTLNAPDGKSVYTANCVFCHGADGKKMYRNAPDLSKSLTNEDGIKQIVREGSKGKMPSYNLVISDENIEAVARYVNSLKSAPDNQ